MTHWQPTPGERVIVRNGGEYGHCLNELYVEYAGPFVTRHERTPGELRGRELVHIGGLSRVFDVIAIGEFTVLRSDLAPVEPPPPQLSRRPAQRIGEMGFTHTAYRYDSRDAEIE